MDAKAKQELVDWVEENRIDKLIKKFPHLNPLSKAQANIAVAFICRMNAKELLKQARRLERDAKKEIEGALR
jgi:hypothetical protein